MKITDRDYKQFETLWRKLNHDRAIDPMHLRQAAERLLDAVAVIYSTDIEGPEQ